jgi:hypothetical protein
MAQFAGQMQEGVGNGDDWLAADGTYAHRATYPDYHRRVGAYWGRHGMSFERLPLMEGWQVCVRDDPDAPDPPGSLAPPVNVQVPYASQDGDTLNCTMGEWEGEPSAYAYRWVLDGMTDIGSNPIYTIRPVDIGRDAACTVTASNALGATRAVPSNSVTITGPPPPEPPETQADAPATLRMPGT